jgi:two-component system, OmpR family, phosphate regulon sensor histidine kinase PhoR
MGIYEMAISRNILTKALISSSIIFLVLLQVLWLHISYQKVLTDLQRDSNYYLRNAMDEIRDSVFTSNLSPWPKDSMTDIGLTEIRKDSIRHSVVTMEKGVHETRNGVVSSNLRVIISSDKDSITREMLRPLSFAFDSIRTGKKNNNFIIRINDDSVNTKDLERKLRQTLVSHKINVPFDLNHTKDAQPPEFPGLRKQSSSEKDQQTERNLFSENAFTLEPVRYNPLHKYFIVYESEAIFYLFRKIAPEISFCIVLTLVTCSAFFLIYRNFRKQERLGELKDEFINNVTHELKTPVATVSVVLEALKNFNASQDTRLTEEYLEIAQRELKRLNEITDRILSTSVLETEIVITPETSDLDEVIQSVLNDMKIILDQKRARIIFSKEGSDFSLHCDSYQLYQMIENLIDNGLKYSHGEPIIELTLIGSEKEVSFHIRDNGIGIQKEYQDKIFDKFFRVPTGDIHTIKGYGLGLSYVKNLVRSLGGEITVESEPSKGSIFILKFPRIKIRKLSVRLGKK